VKEKTSVAPRQLFRISSARSSSGAQTFYTILRSKS
jgi:hypothetical protein